MKHLSPYLASLLLIVSANSPAQTPAKPTATPAANQQAQINSVPQICRIRESEIVSVNVDILNRNIAARKEPDQAKRTQIMAPVANLQAALREGEASWNRMECAKMLYSVR